MARFTDASPAAHALFEERAQCKIYRESSSGWALWRALASTASVSKRAVHATFREQSLFWDILRLKCAATNISRIIEWLSLGAVTGLTRGREQERCSRTSRAHCSFCFMLLFFLQKNAPHQKTSKNIEPLASRTPARGALGCPPVVSRCAFCDDLLKQVFLLTHISLFTPFPTSRPFCPRPFWCSRRRLRRPRAPF